VHPFLVRPEHLETLERVRAALERLGTLAGAVGGDEATSRTLEDLVTHLDELFLVVVVGEVKSGKSTLINALLGREVCAVGPTPVTDRITILRHGAETAESGEGVVRERSLPVPELRGLAIVDTPGTNSIVRWHQELTEGFLPRADVTLFVTSCDRPYTASENEFLQLIRGRWRRRIVFVLAKTDIKEPEEVDEIAAYVRECARKELGLEPEILRVAPREAFRARVAGDEERLRASGLEALRELVLETLDEEEKARLRLRGPVDAGLALLASLRDRVRAARETLEADFRSLRDLEETTRRRRLELRRSVHAGLDRLSGVFAALRLRGEAFFGSRLTLRGLPTLMRRPAAERLFREEVLGDLGDRLSRAMEDAAGEVLDACRGWHAETLEEFTRSVNTGRTRVPDLPAGRFEADRTAVLAGIRRRASEHLDSYDVDRRARELLGAAARDAGFSAAGAGAGVLSAALLGVLASLWWSIAALPLAGAGLALLGWRRSRIRKAWGRHVGALEGRCRESLGDGMERALEDAEEQVRAVFRPLAEFYEAEVERNEALAADVDDLTAELEELRAGIEAERGAPSGSGTSSS
jgi:signal recognition particle receptor subunit beta